MMMTMMMTTTKVISNESIAHCRSDGGDAIVFDVVHYVVDLMSVNHVARRHDRLRLRGLGGRAPASGRRGRRRAEPPEPQDGEPRRHGHDNDGHGQGDAVHQVRIEQVHAVSERLVVTGRTVFHAITPQRFVDARVQLRALAVAVRAVCSDPIFVSYKKHKSISTIPIEYQF